MEGTANVDSNDLVNQLFNSVGSIKAGNTLIKLRKQVKAILKLLVGQRVLTEAQSR